MYWFYNDLALIFFYVIRKHDIADRRGTPNLYMRTFIVSPGISLWRSRFSQRRLVWAVLQNRWQDMSEKRRRRSSSTRRRSKSRDRRDLSHGFLKIEYVSRRDHRCINDHLIYESRKDTRSYRGTLSCIHNIIMM